MPTPLGGVPTAAPADADTLTFTDLSAGPASRKATVASWRAILAGAAQADATQALADAATAQSTADSHIADGANPHATAIANLGSGTLAQLNAAVSDATLDTSTASRTPTAHAASHVDGGSDEIAGQGLACAITPAPSNFTPTGDTVEGYFEGVDTALAGGGGGLPTVTYTTSPTSGDYYDASACPGASEFAAVCHYRHDGPANPSGFKDIMRNDLGSTGWYLFWNFVTLSYGAYDGSGVDIGGTPTGFYASNGYMTGRDALFVIHGWQDGGVLRVDLYLNGRLLDTQVSVNAGMTASTGSLKLGGGGEGEALEGFAYLAGAITPAQIVDYSHDALEAGSVIAGGISWTNRWSYADNTPAATWAPSDGAVNLAINGTPGTKTRQLNRA